MNRPWIAMILLLTAALGSAPARAGLTPSWVHRTYAPILSTPKMADLDGDGRKEIIVATYGTEQGHQYDAGYVHVFELDGRERPGWPYVSDGAPIPATPVIGDLDGDGDQQILIGSWQELLVLEPDGSPSPGFPKPYGTIETAALYDLNGDGYLEILYPSNNRLYLMDRFGTTLPGWPFHIEYGYDIGSPVVGDIDGDGQVEIVAGSHKGPVDSTPFKVYAWEIDGTLIAGWPFTASGVIKACPALGDMDGDGDVEIAVGAYHTSDNDYFYLLQGDGTLMPGWPRRAGYIRLSPPALADVDGDGRPEIFVGGGQTSAPYHGQVFAFEADGSTLPGFPITLPSGGGINDAPILLDLDGNPAQLELLVKNQDHIHGYHTDGTPMANFPIVLNDQGYTGTTSPGPLAGDADDDGDAELVFCSNYDMVFFIGSLGPLNPALAYWPTYKHDMHNTGSLGTRERALLAEHEPGGPPGPALSCSPNPFSLETRIELLGARSAEKGTRIGVFDIAGRRVRAYRLGIGAAVLWDGRDDAGLALPAGSYFVRVEGLPAARRLTLVR